MRAITGLIPVNQGTVRVDGRDPRRDRGVHAHDGPRARGRGRPDRAHRPPARALRRRPARRRRPRRARRARWPRSACSTSADRRVDGFSKGMRQRTKVAAALVTDPTVLVLDEPLNGADPVQRVSPHRPVPASSAPDGRTVIVSSHVLNEVERLADRIIVLVHGRLAAAGGHRAIRDAMDDRPRHVLVRADDSRPPGGRPRRPRRGRWRHVRRRTVTAWSSRRRRADGAGARAASAGPPARRPAAARSGRSTTRSRACSGSSCDDRHQRRRRAGRGRRCSPSSATRCAPASARSAGRLRCSPCVGMVLFGAAGPRRSTGSRSGRSPSSPPTGSSASPCRSPR